MHDWVEGYLAMKKKVSMIQSLMNSKRYDEAEQISFELIADARMTHNQIKIQNDSTTKG